MGKPRQRALTAEEESSLCARIKAGDEAARNELVMANYGLAVLLARRYRKCSVDLNELVQEGVMAMMSGTQRFDSNRGRFANFAGFEIRRALRKFVAENHAAVKVPNTSISLVNNLAKAIRELQVDGSATTDEKLCDRLGWTKAILTRARDAEAAFISSIELSQLCSGDPEDEGSSVDVPAPDLDPAVEVEQQEERRLAAESIELLSLADRKLLLAWLDGATVTEMAKRRGVGHGTVRKRLAHIVGQCREHISP